MSAAIVRVVAGHAIVDLSGPGAARAEQSADEAAEYAAIVENVRDSALAGANFKDGGLYAAHDQTVPGEFFSVEYPRGTISFRVRTAGGSARVGTAVTATALARELATSRGRLWTTENPPDASESQVGDTWVSQDGIYYDRRASFGIMVDGKTLVANGIAPLAVWTRASSQPIEQLRNDLRNQGIDV